MLVRRSVAALSALTLAAGAVALQSPAQARGGHHPDRPTAAGPTAHGYGGAVSSVDRDASQVGLSVLKSGGNAADAAVATAAALGVTEPYSAGVGGGGYFVFRDGRTGKVSTIDGRETAPAGVTPTTFYDPATNQPRPFADLVSSGVSVGVPGTVATWDKATRLFGKRSLKRNLAPATSLAARGFTVDQTFQNQTKDNATRFAAFPETARLFLPGGQLPVVGSRFRNPDLARTYSLIARRGPQAFYRGALAEDIARTVQAPPKSPDTTLPVPPGSMTTRDLAGYSVRLQKPTKVNYRGYDVYGMAPSSSGGIAVGEALNILENHRLGGGSRIGQSLHLYLEASARAFADRAAYLGDPAFVDVPTRTLLSQRFADSRDCTIDPNQASTRPVPAGALDGSGCATASFEEMRDTENVSTTHLSVVDRWGNAVAYTLTIEQTGGSGITVPGRGFLLNNELTDFSTTYVAIDPNRIEPGKRPRSSMSPTIVTKNGQVRFVVGSPGGATIITTVLQILMNRIDLGMTLPEAVAAPRASQRNAATTPAEPAFIEQYEDDLAPFGQRLVPSGDTFTSAAEIGAAATIEVDRRGLITAAAEPQRRGGGTALVVKPVRRR
ncbi:gamma-glutamyltransferase [Aeromicrobium choanae]|uniref:Glutathione hydrolase proenzyme n=1 Tax=Aeromicrobium choanae TaxID=1736691 RepID=A0A1T4YSM7_9ACTN|nr:gamma-glutamyltransferase [Aeromicrobium choanae]SKB04736.1 gamma-glutamyltranspeptidase / glutathione hydrolase [Aeromicrobium choanae]